MKFVFRRVENIVGKEENAGNQHSLLFPQCFQKASLLGLSKVRTVWKRVNSLSNSKIDPNDPNCKHLQMTD